MTTEFDDGIAHHCLVKRNLAAMSLSVHPSLNKETPSMAVSTQIKIVFTNVHLTEVN